MAMGSDFIWLGIRSGGGGGAVKIVIHLGFYEPNAIS
jgi:hypothetical protein